MTSIITPSLNQSPPMKTIHHHPTHSPFQPIHTLLGLPSSPSLKFKCFSSSNINNDNNISNKKQEGGLKEVVYGMVGEQVESLLKKEENKGLLDGLEKAAERVEIARMELAEIEKQEAEAKRVQEYVKQLEARASEIEECQREILEASQLVKEAERSLAVGTDALTEDEIKAIRKNKERLESIKAAIVAAVIGTLAGLPFSLAQVTNISELIIPLGITFASCALYGITYRYVIRRDLEDLHLKTGAAAAFGIVKGLAALEGGPLLEFNAESFLSHAYDGGISVSENLLIFLFATVGLDFCMKLRIISPFPIESSE
ncbi:hypothetical protein DCAR_0207364 [Daucus carota subsp. sativus]|uniref:Homer protein n=1 Tax=Daucus carota subsp. sativus TaxID=79200 RepID=A0AAF0WDV4_DAUCS|nr:PREDICTED: uncharacterized protein LOC108206422 [Daucus carota subsp. sativus]WOG88130.1 hypothetical protein DCAR_0207364 [Daucus carota subsp. sativus]